MQATVVGGADRGGPGITPAAAAVAAGALLTSAFQLLLPLARHMRRKSAVQGALAGLTLGTLAAGWLGILCFLTPYCVVGRSS